MKNKDEWLDVTEVYPDKIDYMNEGVQSFLRELDVSDHFTKADLEKITNNEWAIEPLKMMDHLTLFKNGRHGNLKK